MAEASTKQLEQKLGFWDLQGSAIGQIIGAGIMSLMPAAINQTGRSVVFSFLIAAVITCCGAIPILFLCSCVRLRGGTYTQMGLMAGKTFAGMATITSMMQFSLAMYGLSLAAYIRPLFGWPESSEKWIGLAVLTIFFVLNLMGIDAFAKIQNALVVILIGSLIMFGVMGITKVQWGTYFSNEDGYFMMEGAMGVCQAAGLLTFATGGATVVVNFSAEAKNPVRDIPLVVITSTLFVAVLYAILAFVAAGVLPVPEVGNSLVNVANHILPKPLYYVFIIGGAGCALASTLNNQLATSTKPVMAVCDDGWLPRSYAALNKNKVPYKILTTFYIIGAICCVSGLSISKLGNLSLVVGGVTGAIIAVRTAAIPKILPEQWARSQFKVSQGLLNLMAFIALCGSLFSTYMNASSLFSDMPLLIMNIAFIVGGLAFGYFRGKSPNVEMTVSYDDA